MTTRNLSEAILDNGIHSVNFFNGRLLSGEDLSQEQVANAEERKRLGRAIGDGIVNGLEVAPSTTSGNTSTPVVTVQPGLAINRLGQTLMLTSSVDVSLIASSTGATASSQSLFATCTPPQSGQYVAGAGVYLLTLSPASGFEGRAPVSGLNVPGVSSSTCGSKYVVEGVKFGLVWLDISNLPGISDDTRNQLTQLMSMTDPASLSKLRNLLAHLCFGTEQRGVLISDPFSQASTSPITDFGVLATLRSLGQLPNCNVPLALLYWTTDGLRFVDMGSVRRRPMLGPPSESWPLALGGGYPAIGEAISVQFQEHISQTLSQLFAQQNLTQDQFAALSITDYFRYLPAVGMIPLSGNFGSFIMSRGFNTKFLDATLHRAPVFIEGAKLEYLIQISLSYPPINLDKQEMLWTYWIRENIETITESTMNPPQPYLFFVSGHVPYQGNAQYNIAHWQYSNYATTPDQQA